MSSQTKRFVFLRSSFLFLTYAGLAEDVAFDVASPAFAAQQASSGGSRYWTDSLTLASRAMLGNSACIY